MSKNDSQFFIVNRAYFFTKGAKRTIMINMFRKDSKFIPNIMFELINECKNNNVQKIYEKYKGQEIILDEYFDFLIKNDIGFFGAKKDLETLQNISLEWDFPSRISNAIIDVDSYTKYEITDILKQLNTLSCFHVQIRSYFPTRIKWVQKIIETSKLLSIRTIEFVIPFSNNCYKMFCEMDEGLKRKFLIIFYDCKDNIVETSNVQISNKKFDLNSCGVIKTQYFSATMNHFTESQNHNTCLNRKISIDVNGEIKNCPSMQKSYGNIKDTTLEEALNKQGFKDVWNIKKDDIKVCQDCEFRHICTDCRAFIDNPNDIYSRPAKCNYNPYQAKWKGEDGYVPVIEITEEELEKIKAENA